VLGPIAPLKGFREPGDLTLGNRRVVYDLVGHSGGKEDGHDPVGGGAPLFLFAMRAQEPVVAGPGRREEFKVEVGGDQFDIAAEEARFP